MDGYHVVSLFGSENCNDARASDQSIAIENLRRKVRKMHAWHVLVCLSRAVVLGGIIALALNRVESSWGNALAITSGFLLIHTLLYTIKGHWKISRLCKAKMYWLNDTTVDQDVSPVYVLSQDTHRSRKTA